MRKAQAARRRPAGKDENFALLLCCVFGLPIVQCRQGAHRHQKIFHPEEGGVNLKLASPWPAPHTVRESLFATLEEEQTNGRHEGRPSRFSILLGNSSRKNLSALIVRGGIRGQRQMLRNVKTTDDQFVDLQPSDPGPPAARRLAGSVVDGMRDPVS